MTAVVLSTQLACFPQSTVRKDFVVNVTTEPAEAEIQVEDVNGYRVIGKGSQPVKVEYDERIRTFHPANWLWPGAAAVAAAVGWYKFIPTFQALLAPHSSTDLIAPMILWETLAVAGTSLFITGLTTCIPNALDPVKPDPTSEALAQAMKHGMKEDDVAEANKTAFTDVRISASAPGYRQWSTMLEKPPEKKSLVLRLVPEQRWAPPGGYGPPPGYGPPGGYAPPPGGYAPPPGGGFSPPPVPPSPGTGAPPAPPPAGAPAGAAAGQHCAKDTDCAGDAICQGGVCTLPAK